MRTASRADSMEGMVAVVSPPKPRWRGRIHQVAFFVSIPAGIALVAIAEGWAARTAATVYALSLIAVFGSSAAYHRGDWTPKALRRMKRLDHSMIFVLIAGSYTPIALLMLNGPWAIVVLSVVWAAAVAGITLKLIRIDGIVIGFSFAAVKHHIGLVLLLPGAISQIELLLGAGLIGLSGQRIDGPGR